MRGKNGRLVIDVGQALQAQIYEALEKDGLSLKEWIISRVGPLIDHDHFIEIIISISPDGRKGFEQALRVRGISSQKWLEREVDQLLNPTSSQVIMQFDNNNKSA
jgi:hypothetical protein